SIHFTLVVLVKIRRFSLCVFVCSDSILWSISKKPWCFCVLKALKALRAAPKRKCPSHYCTGGNSEAPDWLKPLCTLIININERASQKQLKTFFFVSCFKFASNGHFSALTL
uniref:Secreted protein n=1 Tax=Cyprinus carpio TaxID=7962 RepID=A0A8C1IG61_CYPCA